MSAKNIGRDSISGKVGDNNRNTVVGSGVSQHDDSRDINQYFGFSGVKSNEDLAEILNIALFGNEKLDFKGVVSEVSALKNEIRNLIQRVDELQQSSKHREQAINELKNYVFNLEKDISKFKGVRSINDYLFILIVISTFSSIITLILTVFY